MYSQQHDYCRKMTTLLAVSLGLGVFSAFGSDSPPPAVAETADPEHVIDRAIDSERSLMKRFRTMQPFVETYIQEEKPDPELGSIPNKDHYFLGKLDLSHGLNENSYLPLPSFRHRFQVFKKLSWSLNVIGWARPALIDNTSFDRQHYDFFYVRREFLGEVGCFVFDIKPKPSAGQGRFIGRLWIEDEGYHVVRFNGTYGSPPHGHFFAHFDSWRENATPGLWIPAAVYSEEGSISLGPGRKIQFKAQTRFWGYQLGNAAKNDEYTNLTIDAENGASDIADKTIDNSPVTSARLWERQAEDNVMDRLEKAGFMAPKGEVDKVLNTVLNNIEVTNGLAIEPTVRVRVLLTTPFDSFAVGKTIVISRGLLDVLPDEASLAAVIAHELAHVALGHHEDTAFAFTDRLLFDDEATPKKMSFVRDSKEEAAADAKAIELLQKTPYAAKLAETGLFLRQLSAQAEQMPNLIGPLLGNRIIDTEGKKSRDLRFSGLMEQAPALHVGDLTQVSALPLGSRIKMDPWTDQLFLTKTQKASLLAAKEKLPFELTPFMLRLTRRPQPTAVTAPAPPSQ